MLKLSEAEIIVDSKMRIGNDKGWRVTCKNGAIVNVYDTGKINVQGKLIEEVNNALGLGQKPPKESLSNKKTDQKIFVVYGHDRGLRDSLEAMLRRWSLKPLILDELASEGATIIEKLEKYTQDDIKYAVVLATPDDEGRDPTSDGSLKPRTRQNVVLELGMLLAKLGRKKVAILLKNVQNMERPSDIDGLIYMPFSYSLDEIKVKLAKEMKKQGIEINIRDL